MADDTKPVLDEVFAERLRQEELLKSGKFLWTCSDTGVRNVSKLAVLAEEFGEAAREVTEEMIAHNKAVRSKGDERAEHESRATEDVRRLRKELIQVAAVAVAWVESLPR